MTIHCIDLGDQAARECTTALLETCSLQSLRRDLLRQRRILRWSLAENSSRSDSLPLRIAPVSRALWENGVQALVGLYQRRLYLSLFSMNIRRPEIEMIWTA